MASHTSSDVHDADAQRIIEVKPCRFTFERCQGKLAVQIRMLAQQITREPQRFHIPPDLAADFGERARVFDVAYHESQHGSSRTPATIDAKNTAMAKVLSVARVIIGSIRTNRSIPMADKVDLGFRDVRPRRTCIPPPTVAPGMTIDTGPDGEHLIRFFDPTSPGKRSKPADVRALEIRTIIHPRKVAAHHDDVVGATFVRDTRHTRKPITFDHATESLPGIADNAALTGQYATYFGRWLTPANKPGPWTVSPLWMTIVGRPGRLDSRRHRE